MKKVKCRGENCDRNIIWAGLCPYQQSERGGMIPLDPAAPVYEVVENDDGSVSARRVRNVMVSHFSTCKDAKQFSGGGKR